MKFFKGHGNGNDFVILDNRDGALSDDGLSRAALALCRRRASIGADGVLVIERTEEAHFRMRLFNADGSEGEMCGNGARVLARLAFETGIAPSPMRFVTLAGVMEATVTPPFVELNMGRIDLRSGVFGRSLRAGGQECPYVFLTVGVPHCVLLTEEERPRGEMFDLGRELRYDRGLFPDGANVTFARRTPSGEVRAVTYERGVEDLTESCGTGCVATAIAAALVWGATPPLDVVNPGGTNTVRLDFDPGHEWVHAWLKGRTALTASGKAYPDAWA